MRQTMSLELLRCRLARIRGDIRCHRFLIGLLLDCYLFVDLRRVLRFIRPVDNIVFGVVKSSQDCGVLTALLNASTMNSSDESMAADRPGFFTKSRDSKAMSGAYGYLRRGCIQPD